MFGEPLSNPMKWPKKLLADVASIQTGGTPPTSEAGMFDGNIPFITPGDLGGVVETWRRTVTQKGAEKIRVRSEERRVGKEVVSTFRSRWRPDHSKKKKKK